MGEDPDLVSLQSYAALEAGEDLIPETGMGTLAQGLASGLDILLGCPVSTVVWDGAQGVTVKGNFGQLTGRKVIITVPTAVLAAGAIRFDPALPQATEAAISNLPMGAFEKHAMVLSEAVPDLPEYAMSNSNVQKGIYHVLMASPDKKMVTALLPGTISRDLYREGAPAIEAFTDSLIKDVIGSRVRVEARSSSNWQGDPYALGSYSIPKVGHADARKIYAQPIEDRLFFTGEAIDDPLALTAGAAWRGGQKSAKAIARLLGAKRG
jgi:monoamine oxidase